jgi:hypothetical protein
VQYERTIFCRRTAGFEWLAEWQYTRYTTATLELLKAAADHERRPLDVDLRDLANFVVAGMDRLILQHEVSHGAPVGKAEVRTCAPRHGPEPDAVVRGNHSFRLGSGRRPGAQDLCPDTSG